MRIFFRGNVVTFSTEFLDADGEITDVATATLIVMYPGHGWPLCGEDLTKEEITLTEDVDTNLWSGTWNSRVSQPGIVYWHTYTDDSGTPSEDGHFRVRANYANLEVENTT